MTKEEIRKIEEDTREFVIENGVLKTLLYNLKTAKKAGTKSTSFPKKLS